MQHQNKSAQWLEERKVTQVTTATVHKQTNKQYGLSLQRFELIPEIQT